MAIIISNTSPIIALAKVDALHLILEVFGITKFYVTDEVFAEIKDPNTREKISRFIAEGKLEVMPPIADTTNLNAIAYDIAASNPKPDPKTWPLTQHIGEASVILKGKDLKADFLLMDDVGGRWTASASGLKRITHFKVIRMAVDKGILSKPEALNYLSILMEKGYKYQNAEYYKRLWSNEQPP